MICIVMGESLRVGTLVLFSCSLSMTFVSLFALGALLDAVAFGAG